MKSLSIYCSYIALLRIARNLTQEDLAFLANISVTYLRKIEHGLVNVTIDTLMRIIQALNVSPLILGLLTMSNDELQIELSKRTTILTQIQINSSCALIAETIKLLRKHLKLTQKQLATKAGISEAWLRDAELGCANMPLKKLAQIAAALDMSLFTLYILHIPENEILETISTVNAIRETLETA